jgi:hypothetical protein
MSWRVLRRRHLHENSGLEDIPIPQSTVDARRFLNVRYIIISRRPLHILTALKLTDGQSGQRRSLTDSLQNHVPLETLLFRCIPF